MRPWLFLAPALLFAASSFGAPSPTPSANDDDPVLPLKIPGYELRVLDQRKPLRLSVGDTRLETSLPIFFYFPTADHVHAVGLLRQAQDNLRKLGLKPDWTAAELQQVISELANALRLLGPEAAEPPRT